MLGRRRGCGHDGRATGIWQPEQPADLVERLPRRVIDRLAEQPVGQVVAHLDQEGVAAADDERHEREDRFRAHRLIGVQQPRRVDVTLEVVHRDERQTGVPGERAGHGDADQQRTREAGTLGDRDAVEVPQVRDARDGTRLLEHGDHPAEMGTCGHLGHDAPGPRVQRRLARHDVGVDAPAVLDDGHRCLITGALDGQQSDAHEDVSSSASAAPRGRGP